MPPLERSWLFARLAVPAGGCPDARAAELVGTVLAGLVADARGADPESDWFFDRLGTGLRLGFHALPPALDAVRRGLLTYDPAVPFSADPYAIRDAARGGPLAHAGSDLALALLGGDGPWLAGLELPLAVAHLRHLTGLVPAADRPAFLFLHWQDRSWSLTGAQRRDLVTQADAQAEKIVLAAGDLPFTGEVTAAWRRYLHRVAEVVGRPAEVPRGFLLAHHAQLTHDRWGIAPEVDSLAAMALRLWLVRGGRDAPDPTPPLVLHPQEVAA
ncbi:MULTISPECIES: hypothetical protein [unclassified Micromonospora]|uniref:hypothetical protein n=1 Tax=unclassified Micromonospora TaxID=2617518 RepID=UPI003329AA56